MKHKNMLVHRLHKPAAIWRSHKRISQSGHKPSNSASLALQTLRQVRAARINRSAGVMVLFSLVLSACAPMAAQSALNSPAIYPTAVPATAPAAAPAAAPTADAPTVAPATAPAVAPSPTKAPQPTQPPAENRQPLLRLPRSPRPRGPSGSATDCSHSHGG